MQRIAVIGIIVFIIVYVVFVGTGTQRHHTEQSNTASPTPSPLALHFDSWTYAPAFIKVRPSLPPTLPPGGSAVAAIAPSSQTYRLARLQLLAGSVTVQHAHANDANDTSSPESVAAGQSLTIVLPSPASLVTVSCTSIVPCSLAVQ